MKKENLKNSIINLFLLHKNKSIFPLHNKYHERLNQIFNEINIAIKNDFFRIPTANDKNIFSNEKKK